LSRKLSISLFLALFLAAFLFSSIAAQEPTPRVPTDDEVNAIARQMYCPVCENTPLDVCPTQACAEWRELIREKLAAGWDEQQIKDYFVLQYGDRVLATPPARGLNWLVYIIPVLAFAAGIFILYKAIRAYRQPPAQAAAVDAMDSASKDEYFERIEEELRKQ
jgi:cytochrome c-type biogenesis protein CcmH